jgi:hypothetical protein
MYTNTVIDIAALINVKLNITGAPKKASDPVIKPKIRDRLTPITVALLA